MIPNNQKNKERQKMSHTPRTPKQAGHWPWDTTGNPKQMGLHQLDKKKKKR